jgi:hypothetical protein
MEWLKQNPYVDSIAVAKDTQASLKSSNSYKSGSWRELPAFLFKNE